MLVIVAILMCIIALIWYVNRSESRIQALPISSTVLAIFQSGILALGAGYWYWCNTSELPEPYTDFIGGFLAISGMPKSFEYTSIYLGLSFFALAIWCIFRFYNKLNSDGHSEIILETGYFTLFPALIMIGQSVTVKNLTLLLIPSVISVLISFITLIVVPFNKTSGAKDIARHCLCGIAFGIFSLLGLQILLLYFEGYWIFSLLFLIFLLWLLMRVKKQETLSAAKTFLFCSQLGLPLLFLQLMPPPLVNADKSRFLPEFNGFFYFVVFAIIAVAYILIYLNHRRTSNVPEINISNASLLAIVGCLMFAAIAWPEIPSDDYHQAESILPWYLWQKMGYIPYIDYVPSRGLINYGNGFLIWLFKGHDFSLIDQMSNFMNLFLMALFLPLFRRCCGALAAVFGLSCLYILCPGAGGGLLAGIILLYLLIQPELYKNSVRWLWTFGIGGGAVLLFSLTDASVIVLALAPMVVYQLWRAYREQCKGFLISAGIVSGITLLLLFTPFYQMLWGLFSTLQEQAGIYTLAHCVPLMFNKNLDAMITSGLFWQFIRFSWLGTGALALILMLRSKNKTVDENIYFFTYAAIVIASVILIQRAGGRIDLSSQSRIFIVSAIFSAIVLPTLLLPQIHSEKIRLIFFIFWLIILGLYGTQASKFRQLIDRAINPVYQTTETFNPAAQGFQNMGTNAIVAPDHLKHLVDTKNVLENILTPDETYLDLTNNAAGYAYYERRPPAKYVSYFYAATDKQFEQMITEIEKNTPVLALIRGRDIEFYEGRLPLRAYKLYRYMLEQYIPFEDVNGKLWMIRRGFESRLNNNLLIKSETIGDIAVLTAGFQDPTIDAYPSTWGNSATTLLEHLEKPFKIHFQPGNNILIKNTAEGSMFFNSSEGTIDLHLPPRANGDFLYVEFDRLVYGKGMRISWQDSFGGRGQPWIEFWAQSNIFLIPLSTSPNWALSSWKKDLQIKLPNIYREEFRVIKILLLSRK